MIQMSAEVRNARLDAIETAIGASPTLRIRTGAPPANTAAARTGSVLSTMVLPADWMAAASNGTKAKAGTWNDPEADASGTAGHFEIVDDEDVCHMQGTVGAEGSGADMIVDNTNFNAGQSFTIQTFALSDNNA